MLKSDLKTFIKTLKKLTDDRFNFTVYKTPSDSLGIMMFFCDKHISTSYTLKDELTALNAFDVLIDLIKHAELKNDHTYFENTKACVLLRTMFPDNGPVQLSQWSVMAPLSHRPW